MYSSRWIPLIFIATLVLELLIVYHVQSQIPGFKETGLPTSFEKVKELVTVLSTQIDQYYYQLLLFTFSTFLFLQTWCIPGTVFMNFLSGALFGIKVAFPICLACNVAGASNCYWISKYFAGNVVRNKFGKEFEQVSQKIAKHNDDLFLFMISSRIFPGSPNWLMNISFPHIKSIKYSWYCASIAIGLIPWNFMTCQAGIFVMNFQDKSQLINSKHYFILIAIALCLVLPAILKRVLNRCITENKDLKYL